LDRRSGGALDEAQNPDGTWPPVMSGAKNVPL
jgi:hypothetical protein